jgi:hypothetical protein
MRGDVIWHPEVIIGEREAAVLSTQGIAACYREIETHPQCNAASSIGFNHCVDSCGIRDDQNQQIPRRLELMQECMKLVDMLVCGLQTVHSRKTVTHTDEC